MSRPPTATTHAVLEVRNLRVGFRRRRARPTFWALDDVSLTVAPGRTMGLIGESGSGKSTLANAVLGLAPVQSGTVDAARRGHHRHCRGADAALGRDPAGGVPGPEQLPEPVLDHRAQPGRTDARPGRRGPRPRSRTRTAQHARGRRPEPRRGRPLPAPVLRRPAATHLDRPGPDDLTRSW